jgi:hypothetical protein
MKWPSKKAKPWEQQKDAESLIGCRDELQDRLKRKTVLKYVPDLNKAERRCFYCGMLSEHGAHLRNRYGGGKPPA